MTRRRTFTALTICQPWAHLICPNPTPLPPDCEPKRVENRRWGTTYRGPLAIHAGKSQKFIRPGDTQRFPGMIYGAVLGIAEMTGCVNLRTLAENPEHPLSWVRDDPYAEGPFCWLLENVQPLKQPYEVPGQQGLWTVDLPADLLER